MNSPFKIKNPDFNVGLKNMTKLVRLETVAMAVVVNDGFWKNSKARVHNAGY